MCNINKDIRKRQIIPHTGGPMSLSRRKHNLVFYTYIMLSFLIYYNFNFYTYITFVEHIEN